MEPRRVDLDALLNAHAFMRVERPPELWTVDVLAITIAGPGEWEADVSWTPASTETFWSDDLDAAVRGASVSFAYVRRLENGGSITVWIPRSPA